MRHTPGRLVVGLGGGLLTFAETRFPFGLVGFDRRLKPIGEGLLQLGLIVLDLPEEIPFFCRTFSDKSR